MKILLTGSQGQIGWELMKTLSPLGKLFAFDHASLDLSNPDAIVKQVRAIAPNVIVNAAAYTAVDRAESESGRAQAINADAPGILAEEAKKQRALLIHYSTDYVYDGTSSLPYSEDSSVNPQNAYGLSKLEGDKAIIASGCHHLIFRTSWVYGTRGNNFLLTMLRLAKEKSQLQIVDDQSGAPTWCRTIAETTAEVLQKLEEKVDHHHLSGIYHLCSRGQTSWYGFAEAIFDNCPITKRPKLVAIPSEQYPTPAKRPKNSLLNMDKLKRNFGIETPFWDESLKKCLREMN